MKNWTSYHDFVVVCGTILWYVWVLFCGTCGTFFLWYVWYVGYCGTCGTYVVRCGTLAVQTRACELIAN